MPSWTNKTAVARALCVHGGSISEHGPAPHKVLIELRQRPRAIVLHALDERDQSMSIGSPPLNTLRSAPAKGSTGQEDFPTTPWRQPCSTRQQRTLGNNAIVYIRVKTAYTIPCFHRRPTQYSLTVPRSHRRHNATISAYLHE